MHGGTLPEEEAGKADGNILSVSVKLITFLTSFEQWR